MHTGSKSGAYDAAIRLLEQARAELAEIHRGKHYALWRGDRRQSLDNALRAVEPFAAYNETWIFTGDGGGAVAQGRFGDWAIDRLVEKMPSEAIIAAFTDELARNLGAYSELSPILGVQLDGTIDLGGGIILEAEPDEVMVTLAHRIPFQRLPVATGTSVLRQCYTVAPAFELRGGEAIGESITVPASAAREEVRQRVRLACLLASFGPVELPFSFLQPDPQNLFVAGEGNQAGRPYGARPMVAFPVASADVARAYRGLVSFKGGASLARAIDRLGRSRLAAGPVDRALELGMAVEIALMHDHSPANTEIAHKIGCRAAWLLGRDPEDRAEISADMKALYQARSQAVHSGALTKSKVDLDAADRLATRTFNALLDRGAFPDWMSLVMGGGALQAESGAPG